MSTRCLIRYGNHMININHIIRVIDCDENQVDIVTSDGVMLSIYGATSRNFLKSLEMFIFDYDG